MAHHFPIPYNLDVVQPILLAFINGGGVPYLVGGAVRDILMGREPLDVDIEVHGLAAEQVESILGSFGTISFVGKQFGVYKLHGNDIDWSLPRTDSKGRKPLVEIDPFIGIEKALRRRDVTMNAMAIDLRNFAEFGILVNKDQKEICDPFGGMAALNNKTLTAVDTTLFAEDPLRFYRVMQFIARFGFEPDAALSALCTAMELNPQDISSERIWAEFEKMLLLSPRPSLGLRWVQKIGRIKELFPELGDCQDTQQWKGYHPEGNVFEHSMQALDAAAYLLAEIKKDKRKTILLAASLCHDLGKVVSTTPELTAKGHELTGVPLAERFLKRFTSDHEIIAAVKKLVRYHLEPRLMMKNKAGAYEYKKLAFELDPEVTLLDLTVIWLADQRGRNGESHEPLTTYEDEYRFFLSKIQEYGLTVGPEEPVLKGRDLVPVLAAGPHLGPLLAFAYDLQIRMGETDRTVLLSLTCEYAMTKVPSRGD